MDVKAITDISWLPEAINSLIIVPRIVIYYVFTRPEVVVYIPKQSLTFFSLLKASALHLLMRKRLRSVGLQKRPIKGWKAAIIRKLKFGHVFSLSYAMKKELSGLGIDAQVIFTGIETETFKPVDDKTTLRNKYNIPLDKTIVLHVGHIKASRNLELLIDINNKFKDCQSVIVGSTATQQEKEVHSKCTAANVIVINQTINAIEELYQLADIYCFPVKQDNGAMETPLSVLEAMSTNLPVITTHFGQLTELFKEDDYFRFIDSIDDITPEMIATLISDNCQNRDKVKEFTWQATTRKIIDA